MPVAFLDTAHSECEHTRHAASNAAHSCYGQAVCEDPSAQDNRAVAETSDLAEGGTCAQAAACCVTSIKVVAETDAGRGNAGSPSGDWRICGTGLFVPSGNCQEGALFRGGAARLLHHRSQEMVTADTLQRAISTLYEILSNVLATMKFGLELVVIQSQKGRV